MAITLADLLDQLRLSIKRLTSRKPHNPGPESDLQMLARVGRRFALLFFILLFFEDISDFLLESLHVAFELIHVFLEVIELSVEIALEHLFHTSHHESEIIMINALLLGAIYLSYRLARSWPALPRRLQKRFTDAWLHYKNHKIAYWRSLTKAQQIKLTSAYVAGFSLMLFWLTL
ncbi:hypothetical protein Q9L42_009740 [Methylomarinum sp. Ch1-1]|uniref:Uncharacterized protein n=1 Tax=Methylomarinum roseum TaxID=3067653 RepID=A0AAU7NZ80_9GAMM|nr:hypothetical protein [Methylomarinum sp. Ch1-1]MDP4521475.1 hypothetical protein [Methylomarinum sp. Ch1-1]